MTGQYDNRDDSIQSRVSPLTENNYFMRSNDTEIFFVKKIIRYL